MRQFFGTDGVRAEANIYPMTADFVLRLGMAAAHVFKDREGTRKNQIVIGKDTRRSGYMIESALMAGITSAGMDAILLGPLPTPAIALMTKTLRASAGIVISASHNPYYDNGIKFFNRNGFKLDDGIEQELESIVLENDLGRYTARRNSLGRARRIEGATERYIEYCKGTFPRNMTLEGMKIVVDCANGAAYKVAPEVFAELGADIVAINNKPDGININHECGAVYPAALSQAVQEHQAEIGIALDGDADRLIVVDRFGKVVDGDQIIGIAAQFMQQRSLLKGGAVVATVMSNIGLERFLGTLDLKLIRTDVGDRYVLDRMRYGGFNLGGEQSGHLVFLDYATTGDAVISALQVLAIMVENGRHIDELASHIERFPQVLVNRQVNKKVPLQELPRSQELIGRVEQVLQGSGRVLVRYSGTEPKVRVMLEGDNEDTLQRHANDIADCIVTEISGRA
ncbi:phosphoglucosamine mutase [Desulfurispira natronophila]|uniref:Phosphoglucosamine mutase n=1 Tax=Desulfurispira natronophila TaxID=682562 RepID=A0A7W8DHD1_9BACT|nr:phosphoglucosamine mutase [Desulfurispira natronophila]MBB5022304.1 phosphoglucosamine mutase [Desulfurispira natronophila]